MRVLVVNAGSSSLKLTLVERQQHGQDVTLAHGQDMTLAHGQDVTLAHGQDVTLAAHELPAPGAQVDSDQLRAALDSPLREADAVGHRIVHGGERYTQAVQIDAQVEAGLRELCDLAPLHQPKSLAALDAVTELLPALPAVACFDTAFHATLSPAAATYALPAAWRERWGLRRYGFHGLSHAWVAHRAPQLLGLADAAGPTTPAGPGPAGPGRTGPTTPAGPGRATPDGTTAQPCIVSCHLGAGASLCAIADGHSRDTTMGFTPLAGLVMATRSGDVDPGLLLWLAEHERLSSAALADALEHDSGLQGLCGSADMRAILTRADAGEQQAQLALDVYLHRLRGAIAAMAAALEGLDVLVFTGGVGEHAAAVRARACAGLAFLGVHIEDARNRNASSDAEIGTSAARVRTLVLTSREDFEIARQVREVLAGQS
jgi:acetate kinase